VRAQHRCVRRLLSASIFLLCVVASAAPAFGQADTLGLPIARADLRVKLAVDDPFPEELSLLQFTVTLRNAGPDTATAVVVADSLPSGLSFAGGQPSRGAYDPGSGTWLVGTVAPVDSAVLRLSATVDEGTAGQTITNVARVTGLQQVDSRPRNDVDSVSVHVPGADLAVHASAHPPANAYDSNRFRASSVSE